ncbi:hypothetical protein C6Q02_20525 [Burkholderia multivorans]|nr:hypothetical protein C6Q02_20525 [Burkholderia multivorans]
MTSRFVDESRFCFRPSTEHRAPSTEHRAPSTEHRAPSDAARSRQPRRSARARKASAPQQCAGGGEAERTRSLSRIGAALLHCAAACDPGEGKPAPAKKKNKSTKNYSKSARTASGGRPMAALPR